MSAPVRAYKVQRREGEWEDVEHADKAARGGGAPVARGADGGAFIFAILGLKLMNKLVNKIQFWWFIPYLIILGIILLVL